MNGPLCIAMTGQLGSIDCHAELLLREKNLEGRKFRHALVHRNAGKKLNALEINMILNWVFENMYTFEWAKWIFSKTTFFKSAQRIEKNGITRSNFNLVFLFDLTTTSRILIGISTFYILFFLSLHRQHMHSQERLHHLLRFTPTPPAAIADQQQQSGEYAEAIRAERFYYQSMASQYMKDY